MPSPGNEIEPDHETAWLSRDQFDVFVRQDRQFMHGGGFDNINAGPDHSRAMYFSHPAHPNGDRSYRRRINPIAWERGYRPIGTVTAGDSINRVSYDEFVGTARARPRGLRHQFTWALPANATRRSLFDLPLDPNSVVTMTEPERCAYCGLVTSARIAMRQCSCNGCTRRLCDRCVGAGRMQRYNNQYYCNDHDVRCVDCHNGLRSVTYCHHCEANGFVPNFEKKKLIGNTWEPAKWPIFLADGESSDALTFGVELEVETFGRGSKYFEHSDRYSLLEPSLGKSFIIKSDGSIDNTFGEIVLCPHSYKALAPKIAPMCEALIDAGCRSFVGAACGLHIHIPKKAVRDEDLFRIKNFFAVASPIISVFSRRNAERLSGYAAMPPFRQNYQVSSNKFSAVFDGRGATVEFRLFRGTLNAQTILASLEFIAAMVRCAKTSDVWKYANLVKLHGASEIKKDSGTIRCWNEFMEWACATGDYPNLCAYASKIGRRYKAMRLSLNRPISESARFRRMRGETNRRIGPVNRAPRSRTTPLWAREGVGEWAITAPNPLLAAIQSND